MNYNFSPQRLAELVRAYRDKERLSLRDLADRTQISAATLSRIENKEAKSSPDIHTLVQLVKVCGFRLDEVVQSEDNAGKSQLQAISMQLRASKEVSSATMQALAAVIRAVRIQLSPDAAS